MAKPHRVYDDRTDETLFTAPDGLTCAMWIAGNVFEESEDFEHVWLEPVGEGDSNA